MSEYWKAYDKGLICRGKQYEVGEIYEEDNAKICECGMHYCENPADLMAYHDLVDENGNVMEVTRVEDLDKENRDFQSDGNSKKYCTKKLKIGAIVAFKDWLNAAIEVEKESIKKGCADDALNDGGKNSAQLASSGYSAQLASSGDSAKIASSGDSAQLASSGDYAQLASSGDYAQLASSGDSAKLASSRENSVIAAIGIGSMAKGAVGNWITLAEWKWDGKKYKPLCVKTEYVDGEKIKADTFYKLEDGMFREVSAE